MSPVFLQEARAIRRERALARRSVRWRAFWIAVTLMALVAAGWCATLAEAGRG